LKDAGLENPAYPCLPAGRDRQDISVLLTAYHNSNKIQIPKHKTK